MDTQRVATWYSRARQTSVVDSGFGQFFLNRDGTYLRRTIAVVVILSVGDVMMEKDEEFKGKKLKSSNAKAMTFELLAGKVLPIRTVSLSSRRW